MDCESEQVKCEFCALTESYQKLYNVIGSHIFSECVYACVNWVHFSSRETLDQMQNWEGKSFYL